MKKADPHNTTTDLVWGICYLRDLKTVFKTYADSEKGKRALESDLEFLLLSIHTAVVPGGCGTSEVLRVVLSALLLVPAAPP